MSPERWKTVEDLFEQALDVPTAERSVFIEKAAPDSDLRDEVNALLASHEQSAGRFLQDKVREAVVSFGQNDASALRRIGQYRIVRELGRGGMGTVYLAERDDDQYQAKVAIKVVRAGMDSEFILSRFRHERQTLARLSHSNIARLLDGGATENGLPYLVMEYIDGPNLTDYARGRVLGIEHRLRIFLDVCSAVDYAHRNFVVHRDLKPGNILIEPGGVPKLLDFGISKLLQEGPVSPSETIASLLTPDYASPEQIRGDTITPASDIYSLGVVLYELLSDVVPHNLRNLSPQAIEREICEKPVRPPSTIAPDRAVARKLAGDLDNIILHAMATEPECRYESVARMAEDIRRYLTHEPVHARPATLRYRARKYVRRNRIQVTAALSVFMALAAGLAASLYQVHVAQTRLNQVRALADKLVFDVHDAVENLPGATRARQLIVKTGLDYLDAVSGAAKGNATAERDLAVAYRKLGDAEGYVLKPNLGNTSAAVASYQKALALAASAAADSPNDLSILKEQLILYERMGSVEYYTGHARDSLRTLQEGISLGRPVLANSDNVELKSALATLHLQASDAHRAMSELEEAFRDASEAVRLHQEIAATGATSPDLIESRASSLAALGMAETRLNRLQEALGHFRSDVADMELLSATDNRNTSWKRNLMLAYAHVADVIGNPTLPNQGDKRGALEMYRKAAAIARTMYEADPNDQRAVADFGIALNRMATVIDDHDVRTKEATLTESLHALRDAARIAPTNLSTQMYLGSVNQMLGDIFAARGDGAGAERSYAEAVTSTAASMKQGQTTALVTYLDVSRKLAALVVARGNRTQALEIAQRAMAVVQPPNKPPRLTIPRAQSVMGFTYAALSTSASKEPGDRERAIEWLQKSLDGWRQGESDPSFVETHRSVMRNVEETLAKLERRPR